MTERLFERDPHLFAFSARVLSCEKTDDGFAVVLDRSAFFPEGGGQPGDTGFLGDVCVTDTQERDGKIVHLCDAALEEGSAVEGRLDTAKRFMRMREHTGEHIVSGIICRRFSLHNVGFHMGAESVTVDVDGVLTWEQLRDVQREANEIVRRNLPVTADYPSADELARMEYRSKKELTGAVRIVSIPGVDTCACCGAHVTQTGEVGQILILSRETRKGGTRLELLCGEKAERYCEALAEQSRTIGAMLSVKTTAIADGVMQLAEETERKKEQIAALSARYFAAVAERYRERGNALIFERELSTDDTRRLADAVAQVCGGSCAVFSETDGRFAFAAISLTEDLRPLCARIREELSGAGGGKPGCVMGSVRASEAEIRSLFKREDWL